MANRSWIETSIVVSCLVFIGVLTLSGIVEHDVLLLHTLQSLIYVAVIWLSLRKSKWGYGIGISIAFLWDFYNLFTGFVFRAGVRQWTLLLHGRPVTNLVQLSAPVGWIDHIVLIVLLVAAYVRHPGKKRSDVFRFAAALTGTFLYFALIIAVTWPQFIPRFRAHFGL